MSVHERKKTDFQRRRMPEWLRLKKGTGGDRRRTEHALAGRGLNTVCIEAKCPNRAECFSEGVATVMILGRTCTRRCAFCAVEHGEILPPDQDEPGRVAGLVADLNFEFIVVTSVTRDDLSDGGAGLFAGVVKRIRSASPQCGIELLIPDFKGCRNSLDKVLEAEPEVLGHNIETPARLYASVRPEADYGRSLRVLTAAADAGNSVKVKTGLIIGLGEDQEGIRRTMDDIRETGCSMITIGQYLRPGPRQTPVEKYYTPEEFTALKEEAIQAGFHSVESGPFVRSSYMAHSQWKRLLSPSTRSSTV